jgi:hypothetical protein
MLSTCCDKVELVLALEDLMERLSSPDLTVAEANHLRPQLFGLIETIEQAAAGDRSADYNV